MSYYRNPHRCQYDYSPNTASNGCTWTSGANGADAATGGRRSFTPDYVEKQVDQNEQTNPSTPGWSLQDLDLAMKRLEVAFVDETGGTWADLESALADGLYIVLQGDSDQFGNHTCSGAFNGDHAVGVHPERDSAGNQRIDDPICQEARYESRATLRKYAEDLARSIGEYPGIRFGVFTEPVPNSDDTTGEVAGGDDVAISTRGLTLTSRHAVTLPEGTSVREYPESGAPVIGKFGGVVDYFGAVEGGWKAVRVNGPEGTVIGYTSTGASVWEKEEAPEGSRTYDVKVTVGGDEVTGTVTLP